MPEPMPNESRKSFMVRCMDDDKMLEQFSNSAQRYAVCNSYADKSAEYALDPEKGDRPLEDMIGMSEMIGEADGYLGMADDTSQANTHSVIRRKGSKKNKPGSAKKPNSKIVVSPATRKTIENKMKEHNKKGKGPKATMGALLTVFRRGAGAFSKSHAPNMSRNGWGVARVNAFLYLLRNGRPSNPNYKQDNDLLPKSHSRSKKASVDETLEAAEYQGKKVTLDKPFRMPKGNSKKFGVYTKNDKSNVVLVRFGDPNMEIRRDDDEARKNYRSRMGCDTPRVGPKWKANYWSCKMWEKGKSVKDYTGNLEESQRSSE